MSSKTRAEFFKSPKDVQKLLEETISQVRRGEIDPEVANSIGNLSSLLLKALEQTSMEERMAKLEAEISHYEESRKNDDSTKMVEAYRTST